MVQRYEEKHPEALLLFRTGDFYTIYEKDAETASKVLGITLTWRNNSSADYKTFKGALATFTHHALDTYLPKLIRSGLRVAICDQLEAPKQTVKRGITELVSPGVKMQVVDRLSSLLPAEKALMSQIVMDLKTGNHLLGRPRSKEYWDFSAEHGGAVRALKEGMKLTDRQRDILLERADNYYGGIAELADMLNMDEQQLRGALIIDRIKEQREQQNFHLFEDGMFWYVDSRVGFGLNTDYAEQVAEAYYGEKTERDGRTMMRFVTRDDAAAFISNVSMLTERHTNLLRDGLIDKMRRAGIAVNTDWQEGERVLAQENGRVSMMGSKTLSKKEAIKELASRLDLSDNEQTIIDVFTGEKNHQILTLHRIEQSIIFEIAEGNELKGGTKHALYRHFGTGQGVIDIVDILSIPDIIKHGDRNVEEKNIVYSLKKGNKDLTVITQSRGKKEVFVSLYSDINSKTSLSKSKNTNLIARSNDTDVLSAAKVQNNSEITKLSKKKKELPPSNYRTRTQSRSQQQQPKKSDGNRLRFS